MSSNIESAKHLLHGYNSIHWPDLSATRHPSNHTFVTQHSLPTYNIPQVLLAIARILGAYCGATDILLAVQTDTTLFLRVSWHDTDTCEHVLQAITGQLDVSSGMGALPVPVVRQVLDISENQSPCVALCRFSSQPCSVLNGYPLTFIQNPLNNELTLTSSANHLHVSVSSQILAQVAQTLDSLKAHPCTLMSCLSLPPALLSIFDRKNSDQDLTAAYPHLSSPHLVTDHLTRHSATVPNSIAVQWHPDLTLDIPLESITYVELHMRANQTARWLRKLGLNSDDKVAVCMPRNVNFHVAMIGIMRAGGCYVPIDPDLPTERKNYIAQDSDARFVFTNEDAMSLFSIRVVLFEDVHVQEVIRRESSDEVDFATPNGLAFLLYTSGTTGNPKGCLLTNKGLSQAIIALSSTAADVHMADVSKGRYLAVASVAFDVHLAETFVPIALGMPLVSAPRSQLLENLPYHVKRLRITHLGIVPSLIEATLGAVQGENDMALRYIASGGEKMSDSILDKWADHPQVRLANFYGPSEATIGCCARYMDRTTPRANIGRPFANVAGYVVDINLNILPRGAIGELIVEGPLVGRGYHGRPDLTEKAFIEWPQKGNWAYKTGDLVRMMPDQTLEILGRIDTQIKLRGVRIESEGISAIIRKAAPQPSCAFLDAATILAKHPSIGVEQLVSFITWDASVPISTRKSMKPEIAVPPIGLVDQIRNTCEIELARYMRPSHIIPLNWLPLSSNGKSDMKLLAQIFHGLGVDTLADLLANTLTGGSELRSATKLEEEVYAVLQRHATISLPAGIPELDIFRCGLDSMTVIQFAQDLKDTFGHKISASDIMSTPTLSGITKLIVRISPSPPPSSPSFVKTFSSKWSDEVESSYPSHSVESIFPPFGIQEGVLSRSAEDDAMYVQHIVFSCKNSIHVPDLRQAWRATMTRHPIMRTLFHFSSSLVQVVLRPDWVDLPWAEEETDIEDGRNFVSWFLPNMAPSIARDINASLSTIPGWRLHAFTSQMEVFLVLSIHHALYDGISLPLLIKDVEQIYLDSNLVVTANTSEVLEYLASTDLVKARQFWLEHFHGFVWPIDLPRYPLSSRTIYRSSPFHTPLSSMKNSAASQCVTLQSVLTCAFAVITATKFYKSHDISFGVIRSGRLLPIDHVEKAICPVVSVIPTRVNFKASKKILQDIQSTASSMVEVEHVPLSKVQNWVRPGKALFHFLFSVSIAADITGTIWDVIESQPPEADYALSFEVVLDPPQDTLTLKAAWRDGALPEGLVDSIMDSFEAISIDVVNDNVALHLTTLDASDAVANTNTVIDNPSMTQYVSNPEMLFELRNIISSFLGVDERLLTETTSFISIGLDSIKSVGLSHKLKNFGYDISAVGLMKHSSLQMLTHRLISVGTALDHLGDLGAYTESLTRLRALFSEEDIRLSSADVVSLFPTTPLQAGLLSQTIISKGSLYVHAFPLELLPGVSLDRLQAAWMHTIKSFDILRTSFHFSSNLGTWAQAVHSFNPTDWTHDTFLTKEDYNEKLSTYLAATSLVDEGSFHSPPIWLRVYTPVDQHSADPARLVVIMHHALYDGLSVDILFDTVWEVYNRSKIDASAQFVGLLGHLAMGEEAGVAFWEQACAGLCPVYLPVRATKMETDRSYVASRTFTYQPSVLENTLRRSAVTVQCLGQAAWAKVMGEKTRHLDVVFGHTVSGRSIPGAEKVIGPVLNTIPCRVRLQEGVRNIDLLQSIHQSNVDALPWQHASLRSIQHKLGLPRLWDSLFVFQPHRSIEPVKDPLWIFDTQTQGITKIQYAINIELYQKDSSFTVKAACKPEYMNEEELEVLLQRFQIFLENLIFRPGALALGDLSKYETASVLQPVTPEQEQRADEFISPVLKSLLGGITCTPPNQITSTTLLAALGIDSITAIQITSQLRGADMVLSVNDIITSRTIGDMVAKVRAPNDTAILPERVLFEISVDERAGILTRLEYPLDAIESILPTSSGMKWMIGSWQRSERTAFHHAFAFRLPTTVDLKRLKLAWTSLVERHTILRSTFASAKGSKEPRIVVFKPGSYPEPWNEEATKVDIEMLSTRLRDLVSSPPSTGQPPARAFVFHSYETPYLIVYLHHFQYDAWSLSLIMDDLARFYMGSEPVCSNDVSSFLQLIKSTSDDLGEQKRYWQSVVPEDLQLILFPPLIPGLSVTHRRIIYTTKTAIYGAALCEERARALRVSLSSVFLACWAQVQSCYTTSNSIMFGLWQAGRDGLINDIERLASPCLNIVPMYVGDPKGRGVISVAEGIQNDLRTRSPAIIQSDLVDIDGWVRGGGKPLYNVIVNIVQGAAGVSSGSTLLEPVEIPYFIPSTVPSELNPTIERTGTADLIQNDLILDFAVLPEDDTILVTIDAAAHIMDYAKAKEVVDQWANTMREALSIA